MKSRAMSVAVVAALLAATAACTSQESPDGDPSTRPTTTATPTSTKAPDLSEHESGPESPIAYGLFVPRGATQLGPLFRYRSARLIADYTPELNAAVAQKAAEEAQKAAEEEADGTPIPTPTPTPTTRPSPDTFKLLEDAPRPDTSVSLMRIDGDPTEVLRRMLAQINAAIPTANLDLNDLSKHCQSTDRRITGCQASVRGMTEDDREIDVRLSVDPGKLSTRTSPPASLTRPVMELTVEAVGDPRTVQLSSDTGSLSDIADVNSTEDTSGLIWPKMDEDAPLTTKLVNGWTVPPASTLLLSGFKVPFAVTTNASAADADQLAEQFVAANNPKGTVSKDVVEDLNSVGTSYSVRTKDGATARAVYILSARGNYTAFLYTPTTK
ncbi:hypothetical protein [Aeromicrobium sp. P5_D10]